MFMQGRERGVSGIRVTHYSGKEITLRSSDGEIDPLSWLPVYHSLNKFDCNKDVT